MKQQGGIGWRKRTSGMAIEELPVPFVTSQSVHNTLFKRREGRTLTGSKQLVSADTSCHHRYHMGPLTRSFKQLIVLIPETGGGGPLSQLQDHSSHHVQNIPCEFTGNKQTKPDARRLLPPPPSPPPCVRLCAAFPPSVWPVGRPRP